MNVLRRLLKNRVEAMISLGNFNTSEPALKREVQASTPDSAGILSVHIGGCVGERDESGRFIPGVSGNPSGRRRGAENKLSREVRELIRQALDEVGGIEYLKWAARKKPVAFMALLGRLVPSEIRAHLEQKNQVTLRLVDYTGGHLRRPSVIERGKPTEALEDGAEATNSKRRDPEPEFSEEEKLDALQKEIALERNPEPETWCIRVPRDERPSFAITDDD